MDDEEEGYVNLLDVAERWNWWAYAAVMCGNLGDIFDSIGKMFHDTNIQLWQHSNWKQDRLDMREQAALEIEAIIEGDQK